jgi:hypothetical protein
VAIKLWMMECSFLNEWFTQRSDQRGLEENERSSRSKCWSIFQNVRVDNRVRGGGSSFIVSPTNLVLTVSESWTSSKKDGLLCKEINNVWT